LLNSVSAAPFTKADVDGLREKQNGCCFYCDVKMTAEGRLREMVDHKLAVSKGGSNAPENIILACWECNMAKGTQDFDSFLKRSDRPRFNSHLA
jgi:5-methylcytosine-specific restriction endonuclease McrA